MAPKRRHVAHHAADPDKIVVFVGIPVVPAEKLSKLQKYIRKTVSKVRAPAGARGALELSLLPRPVPLVGCRARGVRGVCGRGFPAASLPPPAKPPLRSKGMLGTFCGAMGTLEPGSGAASLRTTAARGVFSLAARGRRCAARPRPVGTAPDLLSCAVLPACYFQLSENVLVGAFVAPGLAGVGWGGGPRRAFFWCA
jgi:hypothetical protein